MVYDPATTEAQEREEDRLDAITVAFETAALAIIAAALGRITPDTTYADALIAQAADMAELERLAMKTEAELYDAIEEAFDRMALGNDAWAKGQYEYAKKPPIKTADNVAMKAKLESGKKAAQKDALATIRTTVLGIGEPGMYSAGVRLDGRVMSFRSAYTEAVSRGVTAMAAGEATYNQAIAKATRELARSGLRVIYPSGRTMDLNAAVRMGIMDGYRDTMAEERKLHGVEFGADGVEISAHWMSAPDHIEYNGVYLQGHQFTREEFERIQGELPRPIEKGANCRHTVYDVIVGSPRAISDTELMAMNGASQAEVTFTGASGKPLTMTAYESTQYQRQLERSVRGYRTEAYLAKVEEREADRKAANAKARAASAYYRSMCDETGLKPRPQRMRIYAQ